MTEILTLCAGLPVISLDPDDVLIREGDRRGAIFVLIDGKATVLKGDVPVTTISQPGSIFGEMSSLLDAPYSATVLAAEPSRFHVVEDGPAFLASSPEVALHTARLLAQRLHDATTYLADVKRQFEGASGHFGLMDRILGSLLNQPASRSSADVRSGRETPDPRL